MWDLTYRWASIGHGETAVGWKPADPEGRGRRPGAGLHHAVPSWKQAVAKRLDAIIDTEVPDARKGVKWNSPFYGAADGEGWFLSFHVFTHYVKVTFFRGTSLNPMPPGKSKHPEVRYLDIREGQLDEIQFARWVKQASALPGEKM